jgi:hypothetical protein
MFSALYMFSILDIGLMSLVVPDASRNFLPGAAANRSTVNAASTSNLSTMAEPRVWFLLVFVVGHANAMLMTKSLQNVD